MRLSLIALSVTASLLLSGCESSEEKAERYFRSGMELLAAGDTDRALVEFRNVFKYNGFHKEARKTYADTQLARGEVAEAYSQYLRLIEQYPDTVEVRQTLAELALKRGDWDEVERHGRAALALTPEAPGVQALGVALDYRAAVLARDETARAKAAELARGLQAKVPENPVLRRLLLDFALAGPDPNAALPEIEAAIQAEPDTLEFQSMKLKLLAESNDTEGTGALLKQMVKSFPDNTEVRASLIRWFLFQKDYEGAEAFLRQIAGAPTAAPDGHVAVVQLLQMARGPEAAMAELDRLIAANQGQPNADLYAALRAAMVFETGRRDEAIAAMEALVKDAAASDQTRRLKAMLAQMLQTTGNEVGARARVEEILAEDASNTEALKMRAAWLIREDRPGEAIVDLRTALSQSPRDPATLTLLAEAHDRDGSPDLAAERLAMAVEVSGAAPEESLRYARRLMRDGRTQAAETVLTEARRVSPAHVGVLVTLADIWLGLRDFAKVQEVVDTLRQIPTPQAEEAARTLQAALLMGQDRTEDGLAFLQSQIEAGDDNFRALALMVDTQVRAGKLEEARRNVTEALAKTPDSADLQMLDGTLAALAGDVARAEAAYRGVMAAHPAAEAPVRLLYGLLSSAGRSAEATEVLEAGLAAQPGSGTLRWIKAAEMERAGKFDEAIAVYEAMYADDSGNVIVANNLASLLTAHRDDPESLERAFTIARRLRGQDVPAFQDTYGWIEYRRGNFPEALLHLEPAAAGLPNDALTQMHLGMTYAALNRTEDAIRSLTRALELAGDSPLPQFVTARTELARLQAAGTAGGTTGGTTGAGGTP